MPRRYSSGGCTQQFPSIHTYFMPISSTLQCAQILLSRMSVQQPGRGYRALHCFFPFKLMETSGFISSLVITMSVDCFSPVCTYFACFYVCVLPYSFYHASAHWRAILIQQFCPSVCLSVCSSLRHVPVSDENGLTYCHSFFTVR